MSYSCSDFVEDITTAADDFSVPELDVDELDTTYDDDEEAALHALKTRVRGALCDRENLLAAVKAALELLTNGDAEAEDADRVEKILRDAIESAEASRNPTIFIR